MSGALIILEGRLRCASDGVVRVSGRLESQHALHATPMSAGHVPACAA
jgi:hypothetical protein